MKNTLTILMLLISFLGYSQNKEIQTVFNGYVYADVTGKMDSISLIPDYPNFCTSIDDRIPTDSSFNGFTYQAASISLTVDRVILYYGKIEKSLFIGVTIADKDGVMTTEQREKFLQFKAKTEE